MQNQEIIKIIENLKGRKNYEEKKRLNQNILHFTHISKIKFIKKNSMIIVETGFDLIFEDGWNIKTVFSRIDNNGLGHENYFEIRAVKNN